jgi:hypothetical protein
MAKKISPAERIFLSFSETINERLHEASRIYGVSAGNIIAEIVEENLARWIQKYRLKTNLRRVAEKIKTGGDTENVLVNQDEVDSLLRLMSSPKETR